MDETGSYPVKLYIYDLSRGMARQLSVAMLGEFPSEGKAVVAAGMYFNCYCLIFTGRYIEGIW